MPTSQKIIAFIILLVSLVFVYWHLTGNTNDQAGSNQSQLPNPAAVHCVEVLGGIYELLDAPAGQLGVCVLPDGRQCEEWELFRTGTCRSPYATSDPVETVEVASTSAELAEQVGVGFITEAVEAITLDPDPQTLGRLYDTLTAQAKETVSLETITQDIARFIGVQDMPDLGVSVEDLQVGSDTQMTLIVGLNYSGSGQTLRAIELVLEEGVWKVNRVYALAPEQDKGGVGE